MTENDQDQVKEREKTKQEDTLKNQDVILQALKFVTLLTKYNPDSQKLIKIVL